MLTPAEALAEILRRVEPARGVEDVQLARARGRVLARDVASDLDLPPFEKSAMDGFAVRSSDFAAPSAGSAAIAVRLRRLGESRAGLPFSRRVQAGECVEIYTGAELPADCDAVVMVEKSRTEGDHVVLEGGARDGLNVCHRGEDLRVGATVLHTGRRLSAIDLSVLAAVGCEPVPVRPKPRVAIVTTGDELIAVDRRPEAGQIREGNTYYLAARAEESHAVVTNLGIVADDERALEAAFRTALETNDVVITTGGVSMGRYDVVGAVFERLGVEPVFHKIAIKPGKPLWFGVRGRVPIFALPGNPVSCLIGFEVFVRPALAKMEGADEREWTARVRRGRWSGAATAENPRQQNLPCTVAIGADGVDVLTPLRWTSSADIVGLTRAQGLAIVDAAARIERDEIVDYRPLASDAALDRAVARDSNA